MPGTMTINELRTVIGQDALDTNGQKIGDIEEIYQDKQTGQPEWIGLNSGGLFGSKHVVVPAEGAFKTDKGLGLAYPKDLIKDAPSVGKDEISEEEEANIYRHYGLDYSHASSRSGLGTERPGMESERTGNADGRMTRSEEELRVGTRQVGAGQARLRKWVETEPVQADVDVRRETARVERREINEPVRGGAIGEQEVSMDLTREEPVIQKEAVAREEFSLEKDEEIEREQISEEVRKERVDVEGIDEEKKR